MKLTEEDIKNLEKCDKFGKFCKNFNYCGNKRLRIGFRFRYKNKMYYSNEWAFCSDCLKQNARNY